MDITPADAVGRALKDFVRCVRPFIESRLDDLYGEDWLYEAIEICHPRENLGHWDFEATRRLLLHVVRASRIRVARSFFADLEIIKRIRNRWAHQEEICHDDAVSLVRACVSVLGALGIHSEPPILNTQPDPPTPEQPPEDKPIDAPNPNQRHMAHLIHKTGTGPSRVYHIEDAVIVGRSTMDDKAIDLDVSELANSSYVSRVHALLFVDPRVGKWYVRDLGSTNGTYVIRAGITTPQKTDGDVHVNPGDVLALGRLLLEFRGASLKSRI